jgi:hypothetical protein
MGVLSALPLVSAGNLCCCLWVVGGGALAAYILQQNQPAPITSGDGALAGLLAGITGAFVHLVLSIPLTFLMAPLQRQIMERIAESGNMPPAVRGYLTSVSTPFVQLAFGFIFMLMAGAIFSTLGGLLGAAIFRKPVPPSTMTPIDVPPSSSM